ncbi:hypothetical protein ACET3Z_010193 [Daucus carota]
MRFECLTDKTKLDAQNVGQASRNAVSYKVMLLEKPSGILLLMQKKRDAAHGRDTQTIMESKQTFHSRPEHGNGIMKINALIRVRRQRRGDVVHPLTKSQKLKPANSKVEK